MGKAGKGQGNEAFINLSMSFLGTLSFAQLHCSTFVGIHLSNYLDKIIMLWQ